MLSESQKPGAAEHPHPTFRVDVQLHDLLVKNHAKSLLPTPGQPLTLPDPVYPERPELQAVPDPETTPEKRTWGSQYVYRAMRGWLFPYIRSRVLPGDFHPIIAYLFTEWKCNLDCHYCWAFDNRVKGMTEDIARRSIDWLHDHGCRVLALMGGEPLLRPRFRAQSGLLRRARRASGSTCPPTAGCCARM